MLIAPAAWIDGLSFGACFESVVSCCHPHYLSRTSPLSIHLARTSRTWQIFCGKNTVGLEKSLKSRFCDFEAWIEQIDRNDFVDFQWGRLDPCVYINICIYINLYIYVIYIKEWVFKPWYDCNSKFWLRSKFEVMCTSISFFLGMVPYWYSCCF